MPASPNEPLVLSLFPSTGWWASALQAGEVVSLYAGVNRGIEPYNRYRIVTANGVQQLSVPLKGGRKQRLPLDELYIDYTHDWQRQHWGALYSAYGRAPFYEHYALGLEGLIMSHYERILELNRAGLNWLAGEMKVILPYIESHKEEDSSRKELVELPAYRQVFDDRWGFVPDLSAIDLLMNEGPHAGSYLRGL